MTARRLSPFVGMLALLAAACAPGNSQQAPPAAASADFSLTASQKAAIGRKIWQNECGGTIEGLTTLADAKKLMASMEESLTKK